MRGRYSLAIANIEALIEHFRVTQAPGEDVASRYNIAPTQSVLVVRDRLKEGDG